MHPGRYLDPGRGSDEGCNNALCLDAQTQQKNVVLGIGVFGHFKTLFVRSNLNQPKIHTADVSIWQYLTLARYAPVLFGIQLINDI